MIIERTISLKASEKINGTQIFDNREPKDKTRTISQYTGGVTTTLKLSPMQSLTFKAADFGLEKFHGVYIRVSGEPALVWLDTANPMVLMVSTNDDGDRVGQLCIDTQLNEIKLAHWSQTDDEGDIVHGVLTAWGK